MEKYVDWAPRLNAYIIGVQKQVAIGMAVDWGTNDCCTFLAGGVMAQTGFDPFEPYRGRYKTALGAKRILKRIGGGNLQTALEQAFGDPKAPAMAQRGDAGLLGDACGIILGAQTLFLTSGGLTPLKTVNLDWAFSV